MEMADVGVGSRDPVRCARACVCRDARPRPLPHLVDARNAYLMDIGEHRIEILFCGKCRGYRPICPAAATPDLAAELAIAESERPRPIIKWVGGKSQLLPELIARMPARYDRYYEPFAGGAALFFYVLPARGMLSDANADLIGLYRALQVDCHGVARELAVHQVNHRLHGASHYYGVREIWNGLYDRSTYIDVRRAAMFVYLNKTSFNGLWRVNRNGEFNVPAGKYAAPAIYRPVELESASEALAHVGLLHADYLAATTGAVRGDFVYFDPPYDPISSTSNFVGYSGAFNRDDQALLAERARELVGRGVHVMLSNSDTPFIRKLYKGFRIDRVACTRSINSDATKRGAVYEVIITGKAEPTRTKRSA